MTQDTKKLVLQGLSYLRGDDYERAKAAFRNCSENEMNEQYGQSGKTRKQILDEYANHVVRVERAIAEIKAEGTSPAAGPGPEGIKFLCPVCGYYMDDSPSHYNICPSCGTEFGINDAEATHEELRRAWLATGPKWWAERAKERVPADWNPVEQLKRLPQTGTSMKLTQASAEGAASPETNSTPTLPGIEGGVASPTLAERRVAIWTLAQSCEPNDEQFVRFLANYANALVHCTEPAAQSPAASQPDTEHAMTGGHLADSFTKLFKPAPPEPRLAQANRLYELTRNNQIRAMQRAEAADAAAAQARKDAGTLVGILWHLASKAGFEANADSTWKWEDAETAVWNALEAAAEARSAAFKECIAIAKGCTEDRVNDVKFRIVETIKAASAIEKAGGGN